ncbi:chitin disaccharide deacetylase [Salipaludibacillus agaradhaerens]|uniref:Carbohydrate deacetylase n=1 Tax=Salipaludibacillus agaradhaerens TaxID=76935 RepID=A0A9Q4AYM3_SALAG|nr:chitin disaccharide deacetylase [Salipaludibacillus agaradhaerens]MCR6095094.1 chitin disaccharide deacetylase [Salipaludibacillus agaradhaerens]MCR6115348.1 chitin disaccharide deacetylase [Salipaludibacillus agaradhaerens]
MKIIVNADDFGLSKGVNDGIFYGMMNGAIDSTTMMMNMPGTDDAMERYKKHPELKVGIHLTLTGGSPLLDNVPSLTNGKGQFWRSSRYKEEDPTGEKLDLLDVEREWEAQINHFLKIGMKPSHLDSHHHIHAWTPLFPVIKKLANKYQLPVRNCYNESITTFPLYTDIFDDGFYGDGVSEEYFQQLITKYKGTHNVIEVMSHPGFIDEDLRSMSTYVEERRVELSILMSNEIRQLKAQEFNP